MANPTPFAMLLSASQIIVCHEFAAIALVFRSGIPARPDATTHHSTPRTNDRTSCEQTLALCHLCGDNQ